MNTRYPVKLDEWEKKENRVFVHGENIENDRQEQRECDGVCDGGVTT